MRFKLQFNIPRAHLWKLLKQSAPFALLGILMTLYYRLDGYMIERMLGAEGPREAGVYAASYRLFDAANMIPYLFSTLLLPMFSRMLSKQEDTGPLAILSGKMLFVFASLVSVVCFVWSNYWMKMLYHGADEEWNRIFRMLMISYIPVSMVYVHGTILLAKGALKKLNLITFSGLIINLVLNLLLIPRMHALGATLATLCTQIFVSGCFLYFSSRVAALNISVKSILQYSFYPILIVLLAYLLADESVNRWLGMTVVCIMAAAFAFILGIFRISEFKSLVDMGFKAIKPREGVD